ncbi:hypothetical protein GQ43DRAFT_133327 [Delitschia confertaspora ATCC 74209]|uniref:Uncharacterized protein n=1 Tax=Delitschia confertaspora ATCC 74209 TaxID=1513339 RepID=A0A9P4JJ48_9PLEO|nr:hypothetical protein GQ43DRAFT_133327 [Delitschia confertaspora ATCC 74209]
MRASWWHCMCVWYFEGLYDVSGGVLHRLDDIMTLIFVPHLSVFIPEVLNVLAWRI